VSAADVKVVVVNEWHIECLVCEAQYYLVDYPKSGCKNCGRSALLITDHRTSHTSGYGAGNKADHGAEQA
jgi:rRNA maturation endonuclease Nob1